jgi:cytochrome c551/c552
VAAEQTMAPGNRITIDWHWHWLLRARKLFNETRGGAGAGCRICHSLQPGVKLVGPSLAGIGAQAATRVPGLSAEAYLRQSLTEPDAHVVEGYRRGQMPPDYLSRLNQDQLEDFVAYLLALR